jgi:MFS family permease
LGITFINRRRNVEKEKAYGVYGYRWIVLAAYMLIAALTQLMWLTYAPISTQTQSLMGFEGEFQIVVLALMFPLIFIPVSIPAGIIIDRKGYRYAVMIGAVFTAGFSFLRIFSGSYVLVLIGMIGIAFGQPFVLNAITKLVSAWFPSEESALATGLGALGLFVGMIVALALTPVLLEAFGESELSSLRWIALIYSLAALVGLVLFALLSKDKPPKPPKRTEEEIVSEEVAINWKSVRTIFGLHNFRVLCLIMFIGNGSFVGLMQLIEPILEPKGISSTTAGNIGAVMVVMGVIGCVVLPAISDKMMRRKPFVLLAAGVAAPTLFLIGALETTALIFVTGAVMGFFLLSAYPIVLAYSEETTGAALTGTAVGILLMLGNAGGVIITLLMEGIKGGTGGDSFFWAMVFLAVLFVIGFLVATRLHEEPPETNPPSEMNA